MARQGATRRRKRREFEAVAAEALESAVDAGSIELADAGKIEKALDRPRFREQIRSEFVKQLPPEKLSVSEVAGKIDFDALFDDLSEFFPKLAKLKKFLPLFKAIVRGV